MQGSDSLSLEKSAKFDHILEQGRNSHPHWLCLTSYQNKFLVCGVNYLPSASSCQRPALKSRKVVWEKMLLTVWNPVRTQGHFAVLPLPRAPSTAAVPCRTLQGGTAEELSPWKWDAGLVCGWGQASPVVLQLAQGASAGNPKLKSGG